MTQKNDFAKADMKPNYLFSKAFVDIKSMIGSVISYDL